LTAANTRWLAARANPNAKNRKRKLRRRRNFKLPEAVGIRLDEQKLKSSSNVKDKQKFFLLILFVFMEISFKSDYYIFKLKFSKKS